MISSSRIVSYQAEDEVPAVRSALGCDTSSMESINFTKCECEPILSMMKLSLPMPDKDFRALRLWFVLMHVGG